MELPQDSTSCFGIVEDIHGINASDVAYDIGIIFFIKTSEHAAKCIPNSDG